MEEGRTRRVVRVVQTNVLEEDELQLFKGGKNVQNLVQHPKLDLELGSELADLLRSIRGETILQRNRLLVVLENHLETHEPLCFDSGTLADEGVGAEGPVASLFAIGIKDLGEASWCREIKDEGEKFGREEVEHDEESWRRWRRACRSTLVLS
jgi:hypothetical protein